jgi:oligopeptide/dipeptide ABC transporter ATP-binding protein
MYLGKIVELLDSKDIYSPMHPYTKALISAVPVADPVLEKTRKRIILTGDVPSPINPPPGCSFHTRCPVRIDICDKIIPPLIEIEKNSLCACHLVKPKKTEGT